MNTERSFIKAINTYPINTEIKTVRTYNSKEGETFRQDKWPGPPRSR